MENKTIQDVINKDTVDRLDVTIDILKLFRDWAKATNERLERVEKVLKELNDKMNVFSESTKLE